MGLIEKIDNKISSFSREKKENFNIKVDQHILLKIYNSLEKNDFIDIHETSSKNFIEALKLDFGVSKSVIDFNMDQIQFKYFISLFETNFNLEIPISLIEYSKK